MADDYGWLVGVLGEELADRLWPHLDQAESRRLISIYGYTKDNAIPPPLPERLGDGAFIASAAESVRDEGEDIEELLAALEAASEAASQA